MIQLVSLLLMLTKAVAFHYLQARSSCAIKIKLLKMIQMIFKILAVIITIEILLSLFMFKLKAFRASLILTNLIAIVFLSLLYLSNTMLPWSDYFMLKVSTTVILMIVSFTICFSDTNDVADSIWMVGIVCICWLIMVLIWI